MKDMSQIDLKFDSEQNAFGLTDDFDDLYIQKSQPVANGWLLVILDFNTHKTIAQDSYKSHHVHPERSLRQQSLQFGKPELCLLAASGRWLL